MLLSVTTTHHPATDLGYLLHKHPDRTQRFEVSTGTAHVFYPEVTPERTMASLLLEVDPVGLVRKGGDTLGQYVNDRPYSASSLLAVAIGKVFGTAMRGRCDARPELAETPIPLTIHLPACPGDLAERLFAPLGWTVDATRIPLDPASPSGATAPTRTCACPAPSGSPTRSPSSTCCCPSSTTPSTTGSRPTRSTSCCGSGRTGCRRTPTAS